MTNHISRNPIGSELVLSGERSVLRQSLFDYYFMTVVDENTIFLTLTTDRKIEIRKMFGLMFRLASSPLDERRVSKRSLRYESESSLKIDIIYRLIGCHSANTRHYIYSHCLFIQCSHSMTFYGIERHSSQHFSLFYCSTLLGSAAQMGSNLETNGFPYEKWFYSRLMFWLTIQYRWTSTGHQIIRPMTQMRVQRSIEISDNRDQ